MCVRVYVLPFGCPTEACESLNRLGTAMGICIEFCEYVRNDRRITMNHGISKQMLFRLSFALFIPFCVNTVVNARVCARNQLILLYKSI